ncbi:hypothetical protein HR060_17785 [Catenovulum sp. SM1970]|uniref:hypothetical protein n=1 Tax=Marinifaba aquimaris TaxID=2741323 RepID=UPI001571B2B0|nr:hypothetical protein [Marinifaba aquimaris]NTS78697.1 hypothetical protein [Marinifaba aquimaris]
MNKKAEALGFWLAKPSGLVFDIYIVEEGFQQKTQISIPNINPPKPAQFLKEKDIDITLAGLDVLEQTNSPYQFCPFSVAASAKFSLPVKMTINKPKLAYKSVKLFQILALERSMWLVVEKNLEVIKLVSILTTEKYDLYDVLEITNV